MDTAEGKVWRVISKLTRARIYDVGVRFVAKHSGCSKSNAQRTKAWEHYDRSPHRVKSDSESAQTVRKVRNLNFDNRLDIVEGRIWQLFLYYLRRRKDVFFENLTIRDLVDYTGFPRTTIGRTQAWIKLMEARGRYR